VVACPLLSMLPPTMARACFGRVRTRPAQRPRQNGHTRTHTAQ
jgi:hypothetical protein